MVYSITIRKDVCIDLFNKYGYMDTIDTIDLAKLDKKDRSRLYYAYAYVVDMRNYKDFIMFSLDIPTDDIEDRLIMRSFLKEILETVRANELELYSLGE